MRWLILFLLLSSNVNAQIITTVAGGGTSGLGDGGPATDATVGYFAGLVIDDTGNIYIGDGNNHRVRKVSIATGIISTVAGTGIPGYNGDNIQATAAQLNYPGSLSIDGAGNLYISDGNNIRIRKVDAITGLITTFAGNGTIGTTGDGGPAIAATIDGVVNTAWDNKGNMYLSDLRKIRKIDPTGTITTIAGTGLPGFTGDGVQATATNISTPQGICTDIAGNVYMTDSTGSIRKITMSNGIINRIAGTADNVATPYTGDGTAATLCHIGPFDISVDDTGNVYVADYTNSRIEKISLGGYIHAISGTGAYAFSGDNGLAINAEINRPQNVVLDKCNNVYIADFMNKRVRKITYHPTCSPLSSINIAPVENEISIHPNPTQNELTITAQKITSITIANLLAKEVFAKNYNNVATAEIDISYLPPGVYVVKMNGSYVQKLVKE